MRRQDGQAGHCSGSDHADSRCLKNADVVPVDGQEGGTEEAQFCKDLLFAPPPMGGMTHSFMRFVQQMLLALFNGFTRLGDGLLGAEDRPEQGQDHPPQDRLAAIETLTFLLDGQGEFNGFRQRTFFQGRTIDVKIPKETALYYACNEAERPFYGVSHVRERLLPLRQEDQALLHRASSRAEGGVRAPGSAP